MPNDAWVYTLNLTAGPGLIDSKVPETHSTSASPTPTNMVKLTKWQDAIEEITGYTFNDPDLLEEALESPGSGVTCVGESHRHFTVGNRGLANVGLAVMKLDLRDQCYLYKIPPGDAEKMISKLVSRNHLAKTGKVSKIETFVRPRKGMQCITVKNLLHVFKDDEWEDFSQTIARGVVAIVGAAYYDGGLKAANKVLTSHGLEIKVPP